MFTEEVKKLYAELKEREMYPEIDSNGTYITIAIEWGDWKHDHQYLNHIMTKELGYIALGQSVTDEDGSDTYSAEHYFICKEMEA